MKAFKFSLAVEFTFIHGNARLVSLGFYLFICRIQHCSGSEINDSAHFAFVQILDELPYLRIQSLYQNPFFCHFDSASVKSFHCPDHMPGILRSRCFIRGMHCKLRETDIYGVQ